MAITKLMHMKECSGKNKAKHLKNSIEYIKNPNKTQDGRLVGSFNCMVNTVYDEMIEVKKQYRKEDARQGYHFVISFLPGEVDADTAYEITRKMVERYLEKYQVVFAVHDDQDHMHSHIVFNSVSCIDGRKYHYPNGEWESTIQPIVNELCKEYNLSTINLDALHGDKIGVHYSEWKAKKEGRQTWREMVDETALKNARKSETLEEFFAFMKEDGYQVKNGKNIALRPKGKRNFVRVNTGEIWKAILNMEDWKWEKSEKSDKLSTPRIKKTYLPWKSLSRLQQQYIRRLYKEGKMKKRRSQAWKYKKELLAFSDYQKRYNLLSDYKIDSKEGLQLLIEKFTKQREELDTKLYGIYKERKRWMTAFELLHLSKNLPENQSKLLEEDLVERYHMSVEELGNLEKSYESRIEDIKNQKKEMFYQIKLAEQIEKGEKPYESRKQNNNRDEGRAR